MEDERGDSVLSVLSGPSRRLTVGSLRNSRGHPDGNVFDDGSASTDVLTEEGTLRSSMV